MSPPPFSKTFLSFLKPRLPQMLDLLRELVYLESPSLEKAPADRCCGFLADQWLLRGTLVHILKQQTRGNHLRVVYPPPGIHPKNQLLVLGHYDTVYPNGSAPHNPFSVGGW